MSGAEAWAVYFQYLTNEAKREKIKEIIGCEEGIAMAANALCEVAADFEEYARQTTMLKSILDWQSSMVGAKREGIEEGLTKGRNETSLEIARKMKAMGDTAEKIQTVTGLSTETVAQL